MILGFLTAAAFVLTAAKFVTKRLRCPAADRLAGKVHEFAAWALLALAAVHGILAWKLRLQRPAAMTALGIVMTAAVLAAVFSRASAKKWGKRWLTVHRAAAAVVCVCLIAHVALGVTSFTAYQRAVQGIVIETVDPSGLEDGAYVGTCDVGYICARVRVTVREGRITEVKLLEHRNERGAGAEAVTGEIVKEQSLNVDTVTGATNSSRVILKAAENALTQAAG
jgi:uncharacterized protein with FMN-binding domain